jgi:hypothetical protein
MPDTLGLRLAVAARQRDVDDARRRDPLKRDSVSRATPYRLGLRPVSAPAAAEGSLRAAGAHDQADGNPRDHAVSLGASGRGEVREGVEHRQPAHGERWGVDGLR